MVCVGGGLFVCFLVERSVCFKLDSNSFWRQLLLPCSLSRPASYQQHLAASLPGFREMGDQGRAVADPGDSVQDQPSSKLGRPSSSPWVFGVTSKSALWALLQAHSKALITRDRVVAATPRPYCSFKKPYKLALEKQAKPEPFSPEQISNSWSLLHSFWPLQWEGYDSFYKLFFLQYLMDGVFFSVVSPPSLFSVEHGWEKSLRVRIMSVLSLCECVWDSMSLPCDSSMSNYFSYFRDGVNI